MYHTSTMEQAKRLPHVSGFRELRLLVLSARPRQWSKNLIIYFAFFFAVNRLWDSDDLGSVAAPFIRATVAFSLVVPALALNFRSQCFCHYMVD